MSYTTTLSELRPTLIECLSKLLLDIDTNKKSEAPKQIFSEIFPDLERSEERDVIAKDYWHSILIDTLDFLNREGQPDYKEYDCGLETQDSGEMDSEGKPIYIIVETGSKEEIKRYSEDCQAYNIKRAHRQSQFHKYLTPILYTIIWC